MTTYRYDYQIGTTLGGLANLQALTVPVRYPKSRPELAAETKTMGDYSERLIGAPTTVWHFSSISKAERDQLRVFCPNGSSFVFIKTMSLDNANLFRVYTATMVWPALTEELDAHYRVNFDISFRGLVVQI